MSLFEVGRLAVKIAGRDAGRKCVVINRINDQFVLVDGDVRRRKVNVKHLEPLAEVIKIKDNASHEDVQKAFEKLGLSSWNRKSKGAGERPKRQKKIRVQPSAESSSGKVSKNRLGKKKNPVASTKKNIPKPELGAAEEHVNEGETKKRKEKIKV